MDNIRISTEEESQSSSASQRDAVVITPVSESEPGVVTISAMAGRDVEMLHHEESVRQEEAIEEDGGSAGEEGRMSSTSPTMIANVVASVAGNLTKDQSEPATGESQNASAEVEMTVEGGFCMVCSDKGSGYHYSVFSCEGCKGFFKRTVQKNLQYTCKEKGCCVINKYTRNSCQYCRFQKCMATGMKREAVREDRTPGGKHRHKRLRMEASNVPTVLFPEDTPCDEQLLQELLETKPDLLPTAEDIFTGQAPDDLSQMDINDLMQYGYVELRLIIEWARKVPGFSKLIIEDQMALLKASFMELNVLRLAYRSQECGGGVKFASDVIMMPDQADNIGWGKDLINCTLDFIQRLKDVYIDLTEFCIVNAVVLTYPDAAGIKNKADVAGLQRNILECLRKYTTNKYPNEMRRYGKILLRLPSLRTVSAQAAERFLSMSLDGNIRMNALVLEMMS